MMMFVLDSKESLDLLRETCTVECKTALGRDGQGKLPHDFWPTYSAFVGPSEHKDGGTTYYLFLP
jgi:hypothetical protein